MTINTLFVIVLIMFVISLIGDIVLAHRLNKHTEDYDDLLTRVNNINEWCNKQDDTIAMLNADGVDNWTWYGEGRQELIKEYFPDASEEELEDLDFEDCAEKDLEGFEVLEE